MLDSSSVAGVQADHSVEQILEIFSEERSFSLLDFAVLVPEFSVLSVEEASEVNTGNTGIFSVGEHTSGHESEEDDTSRVDVSSLGVLAFALDDLRGSVELGASAQDLVVTFDVGKIEVSNLEVELFTHQQVFELKIHVGNAILMKMFETFDQLLEVSSDQLIIDVGAVVHNKIKEVPIGSVLHDSVRDLLGASLRDGFSFRLNVVSLDDVSMAEEGETSFVLEVGMGLVTGKTEDFHSVVLLVDLGVNQIHGELGFVQGLDDADISESVSRFSLDLHLSGNVRVRSRGFVKSGHEV